VETLLSSRLCLQAGKHHFLTCSLSSSNGAQLGGREAQGTRENNGTGGNGVMETEEARPVGTEDTGAAGGEKSQPFCGTVYRDLHGFGQETA
jgi:hypothetical protein